MNCSNCMLLSLVYLFFSWVHVDMNGWFRLLLGCFWDFWRLWRREESERSSLCVDFSAFSFMFRSLYLRPRCASSWRSPGLGEWHMMDASLSAGRAKPRVQVSPVKQQQVQAGAGTPAPPPPPPAPLHVNMEGGVNSEVIEAGLFVRICFQSTGERRKRGRMRVLMNGGRH